MNLPTALSIAAEAEALGAKLKFPFDVEPQDKAEAADFETEWDDEASVFLAHAANNYRSLAAFLRVWGPVIASVEKMMHARDVFDRDPSFENEKALTEAEREIVIEAAAVRAARAAAEEPR